MQEVETVTLLLVLAHVVIGFTATVLVSANRRPSAAIAWVLTIIFIPFAGAFVFFLIGFGRLPAGRRAKQREVNELMLARTVGLSQLSHRNEWPEWLESAARLNLNLGALPMVGGNRAELLPDYQGSIDRMIKAIDTATEYVHVQFYILVLDDTTASFFAALRRARARGVVVRVLSDHVSGFLLPRRKETLAAFSDMGAEWRAMLPLRPLKGQWQRPDLRNHRKLVVVDGRIGFTGSQNLIDSTYLKKKNIARGLHWHELMMSLEGPAVRELDAVFVSDWYSETDELLALDTSPVILGAAPDLLDAQVLPSGPSFENDNNLKLYVLLIQNARKRVSITSPYFVPEESTLLAMITAASRGLEVELFVSAIGDQTLVYHAQRSYYEALLRAGVSIYLYRAPTVLHSKHFSIDDDVAVVGSSNMDIRSFSLNMEVSVLVQGREFVDRLRAVEDDYRANSDRLDLETWLKRPLGQKISDNLARLTSSLQ
ncbi:cardiolipin synthase [Subtercola frigoramans]|uniref:Cardiolipin synthase n=1 Tax=Subtercola frigoramans TaxID=120298 RepID=A0ABS2L2W6_9MICO|nr:cardiolipin synthase [Subtercola frigoramans]MBM7471435.1 cardiolipin synthase [Subtercola frigoramans]